MKSTHLDEESIRSLFAEYRATNRRSLRNRLVEAHMGFANHIAKRYSNRGVADDDLEQTALFALVKAVDRFDPDVGAAFTTFAGRTIEGEIKRHFRDKTWATRVPRSVKETHLNVRRANDELSASLHRAPTVREIATHLGIETDGVVEALAAAAAFTTAPLDTTFDGEDDDSDRTSRLMEEHTELEDAPDRVLINQLVDSLPEREQEIIRLRFYDELTQSEISERVGVSQMHVSRLLRRSLTLMRQAAEDED